METDPTKGDDPNLLGDADDTEHPSIEEQLDEGLQQENDEDD